MPLTPEQKAIRATGIGGSDLAAVLGLDPFKTRRQLYHEKRGEIEPENLDDRLIVSAGNIFEDAIADLYVERKRIEGTTVKLRRSNKSKRHPKHKWLVSNIDREIVGERCVVEIKNVGDGASRYWGPDGTDQVAEYYLPQPHHYMVTRDYDRAEVVAYFGGDDLRIYPLDRDPEFEQIIVDETDKFWNQHVVPGVPPPMDFSAKSTPQLIKKLYPGTNGETLDPFAMEPDLTDWHNVLISSDALAKRYEKAAEIARLHLRMAMGESAIMVMPDGTGYRRKLVKKKAYSVDKTEYMDFRFTKKPEG